jgi:hypothetical protein
MSLVRLVVPAFFVTSAVLVGCADAEQNAVVEPEVTLAPQGKGVPTPLFTLSAPAPFSSQVNSIEYQFVTVTTHGSAVIQGPSTLTGDVTRTDHFSLFSDTQGGSCWQKYESLGNPIPPHTTCTIQIGFYPEAVQTYNATLTITQCTSWAPDPVYGFIVCSAFGTSQSVSLTGQGT